MLVSDAFCYALLTVIITATCVAGEQANREERESKVEKRSKREAALLIDSYPSSTYKSPPDIIYQRVSKTKKQKRGPVMPNYRKYGPPKSRYGPPKPKYGPVKSKYGPPKPKYGPPKPPPYKSRKPVKKHRRKPIRASKYNNKAIRISKYGPIKKPYGPPKPKKPKRPHKEPSYAPEPFEEPAGFGEPPKDLVREYVQPPQQNYAEPPVDSYGVPLNAANFPTTEHLNNDNFDNFGQQYQSYQSYQQDLNVDNVNSYSKNRPIYAKPDPEFEEHQSKYEDFNLDSYSDVYKNTFFNSHVGIPKSKYHFPHSIHKNKPWKSHVKPGTDIEHIVVGGQYAEPPGRIVRQSQPSGPTYEEDDSFPPNTYADSEVASSATISPYVNYKHSNMAFSPQNLNDAFSITK